ncbi:MAG: 2-isopropylmalate synthase [Eubacteriales bacterium]|nr:2-isopropylmalate synthase [Eubacteriales bacterium]
MGKRIIVFDTTLRDGEQAPGFSMNIHEKLHMARQLERLGVDVVEAGFAAASQEDFESVKAIAMELKTCITASLCRASRGDIAAAWNAVQYAKRPRLHVFLATSPIHMEYKLRMTPEEVLTRTREAVAYARSLCPDVEFSAEDASRSEADFVCRVFETAIDAGAGTVNFPDTVGYATPDEFADMIRYVLTHTKNIDRAVLSVHCHDDLGMAVANTLAAVGAGAGQIETTINGIGERAGNAALEEVTAALKARADQYDGITTGIDMTMLYKTSRLLTSLTGQKVQANKAVVGENAFAHEAGIHQHGILANKKTYEILSPEELGIPTGKKMVLGKHSGRHALEERLRELGYDPDKMDMDRIFADFKVLADSKKELTDRDISVLVEKDHEQISEHFALIRFIINSGNTITATANIRLRDGDEEKEEVATGDGPIDAAFKAIGKITGMDCRLESYEIEALTEGNDAIGAASVRLSHAGSIQRGRGSSTDIVQASILAYLDAVNKLIAFS